MKKSLVFGILAIFLVQLASAQPSPILSALSAGIDPGSVTLVILFVILFAALYYSTSRVFKGNKPVAAIIAIAISLFAVYWLNQSQNISGWTASLGISENLLYALFPISIIVGILILANIKMKNGKRFGFGGILIIFGALLILIAWVTSLIYEKDVVTIIGAIMIAVGIFLIWRRRKKENKSNP